MSAHGRPICLNSFVQSKTFVNLHVLICLQRQIFLCEPVYLEMSMCECVMKLAICK